MNNKQEELHKKIPLGIMPTISMTEPNEKVNIYKGIFKLSLDNQVVEIEGEVWFDWFPHIDAKFKGIAKPAMTDLIGFTTANEKIDLIINGLTFGKAYITNTSFGDISEISGQMHGLSVKGDKSIPISKIAFSIPNLRDFFGLPIELIDDKGGYYSGRNRLILENKDYIITIDKHKDYKNSYELLSASGGYLLLYSGEIQKKSSHITFEELNTLHHCLSTYLSFLNGQRCSPLFLQGIHEDEIVWTDYTGYTSNLFKHVHSWPQKFAIDGLNEMWNEFYELWNNENDKDFLISAIHWYIEGNSNSGYLEGSIVMIQTALELIYNWLIIEKKKLLYGKDGESISAANKIRLLLSQFHTKIELPKSFENLKTYLDSSNDIHDEIDLFVQIRNSIIHSQEEKRKKLSKIPTQVKYEAQQLGLWYLEISLLKILKFAGKYSNRCSEKFGPKENEEYLPNNQLND